MKKLLFAVCVLCALLLCSASADQLVRTDNFRFVLPGMWGFDIDAYKDRQVVSYIGQETAVFTLEEKELEGKTDPQLIEASLLDFVQARWEYIGDLRSDSLELNGYPATLLSFTAKKIGGQGDAFAAYVRTENAVIFMLYESFHRQVALDEFMPILESVRKADAPTDTPIPTAAPTPDPNTYTVFDQDGIRVLFSNIGLEPGYTWLAVDVTVMNGSDRNIMYSFWDVYLNGWKLDSSIGDSIKAKRNGIMTEHWIGMDKIGVSKTTDIQTLELTLRLDDASTYDTLYEQPVAITFPTQP